MGWPASSRRAPRDDPGRCRLWVLQNEQDLSTRRNAFHMLSQHATDKAVAYLMSQIDRVADWGDILQMAVLELIRKVRAVLCCAVLRFRASWSAPAVGLKCVESLLGAKH